MKLFSISRLRNFILYTAMVLLIGGIGYRLGEQHAIPFISSSLGSVSQSVENQTPAEISSDFALFWDVWRKMFQNYFDAKTLSSQKMIWGAISGMVAAADDPYTSFLPPKENKDFKQDIGGEFEGIGAQLDLKNERIMVVSPLKNSPAEAAGIKPGDYILKVNDEDTTGWTVSEAVSKIRGQKGTPVVLTILHDGDRVPQEISVVRNTILVPSVESWIKKVGDVAEIKNASEAARFKTSQQKVAYIKLSRFGDHTPEDWQKAVQEIVREQAAGPLSGLVFDMRNNPGGYLDGAVFIASEFLKSGVVVSQRNSDGTKQDLSVNRRGSLTQIPMVVIINRGSASAAEIVAGALKDYKRATIVGETSFGKGSVQTPYELAKGASVHITTGKWFTPLGATISKVGVAPDIAVDYTYEDVAGDSQLAKAIELLLQ